MQSIYGKYIIVIPAYNPENTVVDIVKELLDAGFGKVVIVDDGSTSGNDIFDVINNMANTKVLRHCVNQGKGRALKTAINYVLSCCEDYRGIVTVDADGQHKTEDIKACARVLNEDCTRRAIVLGCRSFSGEEVKIPFRSKFGNVCTKNVLRYLCNIRISDSQTGLRGIPMNLLPEFLAIKGERYEYEMNMLLYAVENKVYMQEVSIETVYENNNKTSHFNPLKDSLKIYMTIAKYSFASIISVVLDNAVFIIGGTYTNNIWLLTFCGRFVSAITNFTMNKQLVFKKEGDWAKCAIKYLCLVVVSGVLSALCVSSISTFLPKVNIIIVKLFVETLLFFLNFYFQKNVVFRRK